MTAPEGIAGSARRAMGSHQSSRFVTCEWLTPPHIIKALGPFDLDPCSPINRPWDTARIHYTSEDDGLAMPWFGRVWLNPPYEQKAQARFLERLAAHASGIALIFARTETAIWHMHVWPKADAVLFLEGRLHFHTPDGKRYPHNAGAPSALIAYGAACAYTLSDSGLPGRCVVL